MSFCTCPNSRVYSFVILHSFSTSVRILDGGMKHIFDVFSFKKTNFSYGNLLILTINTIIIWLANFASFDWSIPGPITYGTDPDGPVTFAFFRFCFICTLFELAIFTDEVANHFGFDKGSLGLEIRLFYDSKKKQK